MNAPWKAEAPQARQSRDKQETIEAVEQEIGAQLRICHGLAKQSLSKLDIYPEHTPEHLDAALHAIQDAMDELGMLEVKR
ncbi:MAG: hypothetical protein NXI13_13935 [Proteobacteria bacterium]|nr:hypothetical protein [Pseudomonadota bacterium]